MQFKFGRNRPVDDGKRHAALGDFLGASLPTPPASCLCSHAADPCIAEMLMNDTLGDCTTACAMHVDGVLEAGAGRPITFTNAEAVAFYSATSGYVPGEPKTDRGADEVTVLNYWKSKGLGGGEHKIQGWVTVDASNQAECETAIYLFGNIVLCAELPDEWVAHMPRASGFVWDVAGPPVPSNGHCFAVVGYTSAGVAISTWGMTGLLTWAALAKYCVKSAGGAAYVVLSKDWLATATHEAPNGFDYAKLSAYLAEIG